MLWTAATLGSAIPNRVSGSPFHSAWPLQRHSPKLVKPNANARLPFSAIVRALWSGCACVKTTFALPEAVIALGEKKGLPIEMPRLVRLRRNEQFTTIDLTIAHRSLGQPRRGREGGVRLGGAWVAGLQAANHRGPNSPFLEAWPLGGTGVSG